MSPLKLMWLLMWSAPFAVFFFTLGQYGSVAAAVGAFVASFAFAAMAGVFELIDPYIGFPLFRWGVMSGSYVEPSRPSRCRRCRGTGREH